MVQLPHNIQAVYLQNCLKILAHLLPSQRKNTSSEIDAVAATTTTPIVEPPLQNGTGEGDEEMPENENIVSEDTNGENPETLAVEEVTVSEQKAVVVNQPKLQVEISLGEIQEYLKPFISSEELEVQERAGCLNNFIKCYLKLESKGQTEDIGELGLELASAFSSELNPVAAKAQKKVPVPEGLDLDSWINDPPSDSEDDEITESTDVFVKTHSAADFGQSSATEKKKVYEPSEDEIVKVGEVIIIFTDSVQLNAILTFLFFYR